MMMRLMAIDGVERDGRQIFDLRHIPPDRGIIDPCC
jgi:hypothetical protein